MQFGKASQRFHSLFFLGYASGSRSCSPTRTVLAPFPSVASICHVQQGPAVKTICEMFDFVLPVGKVFSGAVSYGKASVLNLPFGFNWASFHRWFKSIEKSRDIDVSITFSDSSNPVYHQLRNQVLSLASKLQKKWAGRFRIEIKSDLSKEHYRICYKEAKSPLTLLVSTAPTTTEVAR